MPYPETIKYIKEQLDKGLKAEDVKKALLNAGYQDEIVEQLLEKAGAVKEEKKVSGIEKVLLKDLGIGIVLLLVIGSLVYINFFDNPVKEAFSPKKESGIDVDFSKLSPLNIEKNNNVQIDITGYFIDKTYDPSQIVWDTEGTVCVNVQFYDQKVVLRSIFSQKCPLDENIRFTAVNPSGESDSDILKIKII